MKLFFISIISVFIISFISLSFFGSNGGSWVDLPYIYAIIVIFGLLVFWILSIIIMLFIWLFDKLKEVMKWN